MLENVPNPPIPYTTNKKLLIFGDFNIHVDVCEDVSARKFTSILDDTNLHQYVIGPTQVI